MKRWIGNAVRHAGAVIAMTAICVVHPARAHDAMAGMSGMPGMSHSPAHPKVPGTASAAFDSRGRLWVLTTHDDYLWIRYSDDLGKTFTDERRVNDVAEKVYADGDSRPKILPASVAKGGDQSGDHLYITYTQVIGTTWAGNIRLIESNDRGKSFTAPVTVNDNHDPISHRFDASVVGPDGSLWIAWLDKRDQARASADGQRYDGAALYYMRYGDNDKRAIPDTRVLDNSCECCRVAISLDTDGTPVVFWRQIYGDNIRDHALARLDGHSSPIRATHDEWHIEACPHHGPSLAVSDRGVYHMTWYTGASGREGLYYQRTADRGLTFSSPIRFGDNDAQAGHPYVAASGHHVVLVWKEFANDATQIREMESADGGLTWSTAATIATTKGGSDFPLLLAHDGTIYLSWLTHDEGYRLIRVPQPKAEKAVSLQPLRADTLNTLIAANAHQPLLLAFWSLDCVYCREDMRAIDAFARAHPHVHVALISTDDESAGKEVAAALSSASMSRYDNWVFADAVPERIRSKFDPAWHGELPRTYLYVGGVRKHASSGRMSLADLEKWYGGAGGATR